MFSFRWGECIDMREFTAKYFVGFQNNNKVILSCTCSRFFKAWYEEVQEHS